MKTIKYLILVVSFTILSAFTISQSLNWSISEGYSVKFSATDAEGIFKVLSGNIQFDENDLPSCNFLFKIDVNSINTGNGMKNKHAKSNKWFDAENYPYIEFTSTKFSSTENGYEVTGTLKMHGIEKTITIPFTFNDSVFKTNFSVNRLDYKIGTNKGMMKKVSNEVKLEVTIPVTKK